MALRSPPAPAVPSTTRRWLLDALEDPSVFGQPTASVERHETHGSWVFLAGDRALKVKKPVVLPFMDYGTRARRGAMWLDRALGLRPSASASHH